MFTTAVDKLLSQFFALSAEERSCILEVLVDSQPINKLSKQEARCQPVRSARLSALRLIKSCKKRQTLWDSTLYMSRLQQKLWLEPHTAKDQQHESKSLHCACTGAYL